MKDKKYLIRVQAVRMLESGQVKARIMRELHISEKSLSLWYAKFKRGGEIALLDPEHRVLKTHEEKPKMTKEQVKAEKAHCDDVASSRQDTQALYVFLTFDTLSSKQAFCDLLGYLPENSMLIRGEDVLKLIE